MNPRIKLFLISAASAILDLTLYMKLCADKLAGYLTVGIMRARLYFAARTSPRVIYSYSDDILCDLTHPVAYFLQSEPASCHRLHKFLKSFASADRLTIVFISNNSIQTVVLDLVEGKNCTTDKLLPFGEIKLSQIAL